MGRKAEVQRIALERLMGPELMGMADKTMHFTDPGVCRNFLCGTCPHDLFSNTVRRPCMCTTLTLQKMDLGPCPKSHLPRYKELYDAAVERGETFPNIVADFQRNIHMFVGDIDRKIGANRRRLEQTPEEMERYNAMMRDINEVQEAITAATDKMEELGEQGRVEESLKELEKVEALKAERADKEKELQTLQENSGASGHQKLRVCDICGAYLSILDSDRRLADHFSGKMHMGYQRLRDLLKEIQSSDQKNLGTEGATSRERERDRNRDRHRPRHRSPSPVRS